MFLRFYSRLQTVYSVVTIDPHLIYRYGPPPHASKWGSLYLCVKSHPDPVRGFQ